MSATDTLRTVLELEERVSVPATVAAEAVENLGDESALTERKIDSLSDEMVQAAITAKSLASSIDEVADESLPNFLKGVTDSSSGLSGSLVPAAAKAVAVFSGGAGLAGSLVHTAVQLNAVGFAVGFVGSSLTYLANLATAIGPGIGQALGVGLSFPLMEGLKEYDSNVRVFRSVLGSQQSAAQMMGFIENYGLTSNFGQSPLTETAKTLSLGGQDVNRFLPVAETIGLFGGGTDEVMNEVSAVLRRLMGGQIADAFGPEGLGRFGINRKMLEGAGAQFNNQGQFQGTIDDALRVLETLTQTDEAMKRIRQEMQGSVASVTSNFFDALNKNVRLFSETVAEKALPMISELTDGLINMANSEVPSMLGDLFTDVFGMGGEMAFTFDSVAASFLATVETALSMASNGFNFIMNAFKSIDPFLDKVQSALLASDVYAFKLAGIGLSQGRAAFKAGAVMLQGALTNNGESPSWSENFDKFYFSLQSARNRPREEVTAPGTGKQNSLLEAQTQAAQEANSHLASISNNTQIMAEASVRRMVLGGGEMGAQGVTAYDRSKYQGRSSGRLREAIDNLVDAIGEQEARTLQSFGNMIQGRA